MQAPSTIATLRPHRPRRPSVRSRASTLWSEVLRMLNEPEEGEGAAAVMLGPDSVCVYCLACPATTADHVRPAGAALASGTSALLPCCASCNSSKGKTELGQWMVNKFGFSNAVVARLCALEALPGVRHGKEARGRIPSPSPSELAELRRLCYDFCARLHDRVLAVRGGNGLEASLLSRPRPPPSAHRAPGKQMISLESSSRTTTLVELGTSCTVAEFNASNGLLRAEDAPLIAFTRIAVPSRDAARLRLDNRDMGPLSELGGKVLPEPGFVEGWYTPSRAGTKHPEPYKKIIQTNNVHSILQNNGLEAPEGGYVSRMNYDTMRIDGADPDERVEIRGINIRCEAHGIRYWMFA